ncbi:tetratricopeptide repeat protein [Leptotrichia sp.]
MKKKILSVFLFLATTLAVNAAQPKKPAKASKTNTTVNAQSNQNQQYMDVLKQQMQNAGIKKSSISSYEKATNSKQEVEKEKLYKKAIKEDEKNIYAYNDLGVLYINQKKFQEAANILEESLKYFNQNTSIYQNLLIAYRGANNAQGYANTVAKMVNNLPEYPDGYSLGANILIERGQYAQAVPYLEKLASIYETGNLNGIPEYVQKKNVYLNNTYALLIVTLVNAKQTQKAIDTFVAKREFMKQINPGNDSQILEMLQKVNEEFKTNKQVYESNLRKLQLPVPTTGKTTSKKRRK